MSEDSRPGLKTDAIALIAALAATVLRFPVEDFLDDRFPYGTYYVALLCVALTGSRRAVLLCHCDFGDRCAYFFMSPDPSFRISSQDDVARMALFVLTGVLVALLADRVHLTRGACVAQPSPKRARPAKSQVERKRLHDI